MIPDYLIYDELKRRREETQWEPEPLHLPLYSPENYEKAIPESDKDQTESERGIVIIDMDYGWSIDD
jgi:hypothetical protein